ELAVDISEGADRHDLREVTRTGQAGQASLARRAGKECRGNGDGLNIVFAVRLCLPDLPGLPLSSLLFGGRRGHEQVRLVQDEVVLAVDGQFVVLAHEDGADRAGLCAVAAEDAASLVNL